MLTIHIAVIMLLTAVVSVIACREVTISNVILRQDTDGHLIDAHDGNVLLYNSLYYDYHGASYDLCKESSDPLGCTEWHTGRDAPVPVNWVPVSV